VAASKQLVKNSYTSSFKSRRLTREKWNIKTLLQTQRMHKKNPFAQSLHEATHNVHHKLTVSLTLFQTLQAEIPYKSALVCKRQRRLRTLQSTRNDTLSGASPDYFYIPPFSISAILILYKNEPYKSTVT